MSETIQTELELVLHVKGAEPHTLAAAKVQFADKESEYYLVLAEVLENTAKRLRKDAGK